MCLKLPKVSLQDSEYRYPSIGTGTRVLNKHECPYMTLSNNNQESVPVPKYRYPRHKYRYPQHQKGNNGWKMSPTAPNNSQRAPTARYSIETIKQASKHQEKTNASLYNINMIKNCLSA
ncbi:hypothetical protein GQ457_10G008510 [Hibiscus cannabinus]